MTLNIRFNKTPAIAGSNRVAPPNGPLTFPLDETTAEFLKTETLADSVVVLGDAQLDDGDFQLDDSGKIAMPADKFSVPKPLYPGEPLYWQELSEVVRAQLLRREKQVLAKNPKEENPNYEASCLNRWPNLWYDRTQSKLNPWKERVNKDETIHPLTLDDVANAVAGEFSNFHQQDIIKTIADWITGHKDEKIIDLGQPFRSKRDFIGLQLRMAVINAWCLEAVAPVNFMTKWYYGVPRPEEVAFQIACDQLTTDKDGVPENLVKDIKSMQLGKASDFTAYETGSPTHPSFPAMHSAGSTCSLWVPALFDINQRQYKELLRIDYAVAYARTVAGVHYQQDNIAGLNLGQKIMIDKLPKFLEDNYGYEADKVRKRLELFAFDWSKYDSRSGKIHNEPIEDRLKKLNGDGPVLVVN